MILTILDTKSIQEYVFSTNKLRQVVGASYLVNSVHKKWVQEILETLNYKHNLLDISSCDTEKIYNDALHIEDGLLDVEIMYAGGGNTLILFNTESNSYKFTQELTKRIIRDAPGIQLIISHYKFDWSTDVLGGPNGVLHKAFLKLGEAKKSPPPVTNEPGLGITFECSYTSQPSIDLASKKPISAEVKAKIDAESEAHAYLEKCFTPSTNASAPLRFHRNLDDLGRNKGEKSLLAVVHADGNGLGKRIQKIRDDFLNPISNRKCINAHRDFSLSVQKAALAALQETITTLMNNIDPDKKIAGEIEIKDNYLPFRPIVFGGDDLTFICDGRLGISLAVKYLQAVEKKALSDEYPLYCRAGVAIVKTHFPFARAYKLAEELCSSAKRLITDYESAINEETKGRNKIKRLGCSTVDWHYSLVGLVNDLFEIRQKEYTTSTGNLNMRPLFISKTVEMDSGMDAPEIHRLDWRTWSTFSFVVDQFLTTTTWKKRRNKIKALRNSLREGKVSTAQFCLSYDTKLPTIAGQTHPEGWIFDRCAYFDAIECLDSFINLT